ncbi:MAG: hypothetical protein AB7O24_15385 [Kofleriaceae bacterium]
MSLRLRICLVGAALAIAPAHAGTVTGKLELPPPPERAPIRAKGFLDRMENALAPVRSVSVTPLLAVALEGTATPTAPPEMTWVLAGESFKQPLVIVPVGAQVVISNESKTPRSLVAEEDPKLLPPGPINPKATKSFRGGAPTVLTITDPNATHLRGKVVVVATPYVAMVDDAGKFEIPNVAEGTYQVKVYFYNAPAELAAVGKVAAAPAPAPAGAGSAADPAPPPARPDVAVAGGPSRWLDVRAQVNVGARGRADVTVKVPDWGSAPKK